MTPIVRVAVGLAVVVAALVVAVVAWPKGSSSPSPATTVAGPTIQIDQGLAKTGTELFSSKYGCVGCHAVTSLGISGSTAGPDLSRALFAAVPAGTPPTSNPLEKWFSDKGLTNPRSDPDKAATLLVEYIQGPPSSSPVMGPTVQRLKSVAGGDDKWAADVKAIAEFLKKAAVNGN